MLTVDDDPAFLDVAREVVMATPGFDAVGEAATGEAAVSLVSELRPQLVLMDVRMPGIGGIEAARRIAERERGHIAVVLMSADARMLEATAMTLGDAVRIIRKERLCPAALRALWSGSTS